MTDTLPPGPINDLGEYMSELSEEHWSAGWLLDLEWMLWDDLSAFRNGNKTTWFGPSLVADRFPSLDRLQRSAGGWVWWLDGMRFVTDDEWAALWAERERDGDKPRPNADLGRLVLHRNPTPPRYRL